MLQMKLFQSKTFLPMPYEEAMAPRRRQGQEKLQKGSGAGGEFTGWVDLPRSYDREELARIQAAAKRIQRNSQALVVIGIGGSYLGCLLYTSPPRRSSGLSPPFPPPPGAS